MSFNTRSTRVLSWICDFSLLVCLFVEIVFAHSLVSQASLVFFVCCTAMLALIKKRLYFSWWMIVAALVILWSAIVSVGWAFDRTVSLDMVKTLIFTTVFFYFVFQYLLLRADMRRYLAIYVIALTLVVCYLYYCERMEPWSITRLGVLNGVHPNTVGLTSAFAVGACIVLAGKRWRLLWLLPIPVLLIGILLAVSFGSLVIAGGLMVALLLVRFPKKWGWKLGAFALSGAVALYLVLFTNLFAGFGSLAHVREVGLYFLKGEGVGGSSAERISLLRAAWGWFLQRPMTGWGLACFRFLDGSLEMYAHNNYLELLVSGGIPMALIYYIGQFGAFFYAARALKRAKAEDPNNERVDERREVLVFCVLLAAHLVMDIGGVTYYERHYAVYAVLLFAAARLLNLSTARINEKKPVQTIEQTNAPT